MNDLKQYRLVFEQLTRIYRRVIKLEETIVQQFVVEFDPDKEAIDLINSLEKIEFYDKIACLCDRSKLFLDKRIVSFDRRIKILERELKDEKQEQ